MEGKYAAAVTIAAICHVAGLITGVAELHILAIAGAVVALIAATIC